MLIGIALLVFLGWGASASAVPRVMPMGPVIGTSERVSLHDLLTDNPALVRAANDLVDSAGGMRALRVHDDGTFENVPVVRDVPETQRSTDGDDACGPTECDP
jgi:hypothetical protein